nr:YetF domain-containing protein [Halalkalibacter alkalisediminis]
MTVMEIIIRATVGFVVLYILCRLLNKKLIAQMNFFDFVAGITIGSIVASSMITKDVPVWIGMIGLILFCFYTFLTSVIAIKSLRGRKVLEDEETYLIQDGQVLEEGLKKVRLTIDGLLTSLRKKVFFMWIK